MPSVSFSHYSGPKGDYDNRKPTKASTAIAIGDAVMEDTGFSPATTGNKVYAIALEAKAVGDTSQDPILTQSVFIARAKFFGTREAGTLDADDINDRVDLQSPDGFDADDTTNGDLLLDARLDADSAVLQFSDPAWLNATN
tara:strand:+ start:5342 stop:5764 length:423 start_codon:yes stop_codon:yes gene_type:complete